MELEHISGFSTLDLATWPSCGPEMQKEVTYAISRLGLKTTTTSPKPKNEFSVYLSSISLTRRSNTEEGGDVTTLSPRRPPGA